MGISAFITRVLHALVGFAPGDMLLPKLELTWFMPAAANERWLVPHDLGDAWASMPRHYICLGYFVPTEGIPYYVVVSGTQAYHLPETLSIYFKCCKPGDVDERV